MIVSSRLFDPVDTGKMLGDFAEGDVIKLDENGTLVEFYVAKHDYEPGLNGNGRTLVVRKGLYGYRRWNTEGTNVYAESTTLKWLNSDYKALLSSKVQQNLGTKYYATAYGPDSGVEPFESDVFILSLKEFDRPHYGANDEGSALPNTDLYRIGMFDGIAEEQLTRTPATQNEIDAVTINKSGYATSRSVTYEGACVRPCFTLPVTIMVKG